MNRPQLTEHELTSMIDHTALKPETQKTQIVDLCKEAREHGFGAVCLSPTWIAVAKKELEGTHVRIASVIGFPHGNTLSCVKAFEAERAIELGADELDMVVNIGALKDSNEFTVACDIRAVVSIARPNSCVVKVIIEAALLTTAEKELACRLAKKEGADFVKTSTGFAGEGKGATVEDVRMMRSWVGDSLGVKAAGGIRDCGTVLSMIQAGATRIGCSNSVQILREFRLRRCVAAD